MGHKEIRSFTNVGGVTIQQGLILHFKFQPSEHGFLEFVQINLWSVCKDWPSGVYDED